MLVSTICDSFYLRRLFSLLLNGGSPRPEGGRYANLCLEAQPNEFTEILLMCVAIGVRRSLL